VVESTRMTAVTKMTKDKVNQSHPSDDARLGCPTKSRPRADLRVWRLDSSIHSIRFDSLTAFLSRDLSTCHNAIIYSTCASAPSPILATLLYCITLHQPACNDHVTASVFLFSSTTVDCQKWQCCSFIHPRQNLWMEFDVQLTAHFPFIECGDILLVSVSTPRCHSQWR
jgi:hypothetical protein